MERLFAGTQDVQPAAIDVVVATLLASPVLPRLATLQATLDPLDVEGLLALPTLNPLPKSLPKPSMDEFSEIVSLYLSDSDAAAPRPWTDRQHVLAFLLSAAFKDCSIIARIHVGQQTHGPVRVIDLDPKPIDRLRRWSDLDRNIVQAWGEWLEGSENGYPPCVSNKR